MEASNQATQGRITMRGVKIAMAGPSKSKSSQHGLDRRGDKRR